MIRKDLIIAVLVIFCLTAMLFMIVPRTLDLQNRVSALEEKQAGEKSIVLYTSNETASNETMNNEMVWKDAAVFVWNPRDITHNAILSGFFFFRYLSQGNMQVTINNCSVFASGVARAREYAQSDVYTFTTNPIKPNQNSYTIKFQIYALHPGVPMHVKDVHIVLDVMDGLPPT